MTETKITMTNGIDQTLEKKRFLLRPMLESDINALLLIFTDPKVMAAFDHPLFTRYEIRYWKYALKNKNA